MTHPSPPMLYDYYNFPAFTYEVRYPAPGDPELADRTRALIESAGMAAGVDAERGFDHGMFSPMAVAWPKADLPVVQLSLRHGLQPAEHLALGRALAPLRDQGILIVGSGLSYHNLRNFGPGAKAPSAAFDGWLYRTMGATGIERSDALAAWEQAPAARAAHPREEHLLPLMVAVGAAENESATRVYHEDAFFGGISASSYRFG
jgi:aromatic ring-opening dioxygenase catalytic subunit (LigB family)